MNRTTALVIGGVLSYVAFTMSGAPSEDKKKKTPTKPSSLKKETIQNILTSPSFKKKKTATNTPQTTPHMILSPPNSSNSNSNSNSRNMKPSPDIHESGLSKMVRSLSRTRLSDIAMSPTQKLRLDDDLDENNDTDTPSQHIPMDITSSSPGPVNKTPTNIVRLSKMSRSGSFHQEGLTTTGDASVRFNKKRPSKRNTDLFIGTTMFAVLLLYALFLVHSYGDQIPDLYALFVSVASFDRIPSTAQDIPAAIVATALSLPFMWFLDMFIARPLFNDENAQWFFLHSIANLFVVIGALPDFYYAALQPASAMSVEYCRAIQSESSLALVGGSLSKYACSDWPTCIIVAVHTYHMLAFHLNGEDLFHHCTFVPVIGGGHFLYPWGLAGNLLCFFISGLPGGIDYFLLALYKDKQISSLTEKRINLSINVWMRSPGIVMFCCLVLVNWLQPPQGTPASDLMPWYGFFPALMLIFYNGQYYGMRVIGNYYIRITQDEYSKIPDVVVPRVSVELHAS